MERIWVRTRMYYIVYLGSSGNKKPVVISKEALLKCAKFMNKRIDNKNTDREIIQGATDHAFVIGRVISANLVIQNTK